MGSSTVASKTTILIVDDHPVFRLGLGELIEQSGDLTVCGGADDANQAWQSINELNPDLVIVDITLKTSDGIDLVKQINSHFKQLPVLVVSMHDESLYAERALLAGARGYIMKQEATDSIVHAIRHVLKGKIYASDDVKETIFSRHVDPGRSEAVSAVDSLTNRELEVFRLFGKGLSTKEIAETLHLSIKTIGTYRERIKEKLSLKHISELISYAAHWTNNRQ